MQNSNDEVYLSDGELGVGKMSISAGSGYYGYDFAAMTNDNSADDESTRSVSPTSLPPLPDSPLTSPKLVKDRLKNSSEFFNSKKRDNTGHVDEAEVKPPIVGANSESDQQTTKDKGRKKLRQALSGSQESFSSVSTLEDFGSFHL